MPRYFTHDHEWIDVSGEIATVGITDYAQAQLGDITFVELPVVGAILAKGDSASVVDSVKAASDVFAPVSGTVTGANPALEQSPELVIFGSGARLRFAQPQWLEALYLKRIGVETMDTQAACRTYNILAGEGRDVLLAVLIENASPP